MIPLTITPDIERAPWDDDADRLHPDSFHRLSETEAISAKLIRIGLLRNATHSGRATVMLAIELPDGRIVWAETTYRLWRLAVTALAATPAAAEEPLDD